MNPPLLPSTPRRRAGRLVFRLLVVALLSVRAGAADAADATPPPAETLSAAIELFSARRYPEARAALERIVAAAPDNATAHHYLGRTLVARHDLAAVEEGLQHLARATELEPRNAAYLGIYGGAALQHAGRTRSLLAATRGREAMEQALRIDPDYLDAREGLFHFYVRAPWPLGSRAKADAQLEEIRRRNPDLATVLSVGSRVDAKDYAGAFQLCEEVLVRQPENYTALYHFGRCASISGQQLERGLASLQRCLTLTPPTPAAPSHSNVWHRIGNVLEQLQRPDDARAAYRSALERDPHNRQASEALARLR